MNVKYIQLTRAIPASSIKSNIAHSHTASTSENHYSFFPQPCCIPVDILSAVSEAMLILVRNSSVRIDTTQIWMELKWKIRLRRLAIRCGKVCRYQLFITLTAESQVEQAVRKAWDIWCRVNLKGLGKNSLDRIQFLNLHMFQCGRLYQYLASVLSMPIQPQLPNIQHSYRAEAATMTAKVERETPPRSRRLIVGNVRTRPLRLSWDLTSCGEVADRKEEYRW